MKLSVCVTNAKQANDVYMGLQESCGDHAFEVIVVAHEEPSKSFLDQPNTIWVPSGGSVVDRQERALIECHGEFVGVSKTETNFKDSCVSKLLENTGNDKVGQCRCLNLATKEYVVKNGGLGCLTVHKKPLVAPVLKMSDENIDEE